MFLKIRFIMLITNSEWCLQLILFPYSNDLRKLFAISLIIADLRKEQQFLYNYRFTFFKFIINNLIESTQESFKCILEFIANIGIYLIKIRLRYIEIFLTKYKNPLLCNSNSYKQYFLNNLIHQGTHLLVSTTVAIPSYTLLHLVWG